MYVFILGIMTYVYFRRTRVRLIHVRVVVVFSVQGVLKQKNNNRVEVN